MAIDERFGAGTRILVVGGAGFVPSHIVDRLLERGATVVAVDNFVTGSEENVAHLRNHPGFSLVKADISTGVPPGLAEPFQSGVKPLSGVATLAMLACIVIVYFDGFVGAIGRP